METKPTLICIPDISGFTEFMSDTHIELSSIIIPSLLNKIIYANDIDLKVSEIEGDAILFYRTGPLPSFKVLIEQCRNFYVEFYKQLKVLRNKHKGHDDVSNIPEILGLKIILHYGEEIGAVQIGKSIKLMGEDVIVAHRLLKNDIKRDEYLLLSESLMNNYKDDVIERNFGWGELIESDEKYKHIGEVNYSYINLEPLVD
jgi:hypothetical protein